MPDSELTEEQIRNMDQKEFRKELPSGWMKLARYETNVLLVDTLLEESPSREFTVNELADKSGASARSIRNRIDDLVELDIVCELPDRENTRYSLNQYSPIVQDIHVLNSTVERVVEGELESSTSPSAEHNNEPRGNILGDGSSEHVEPDVRPQI